MAARDQINWVDLIARSVLCLLYGAGACFAGCLSYALWLDITSGNPEYTVTITGVDGLDPVALEQRSDQAAAVSPVFDIAVRIDNSLNKAGKQCIGKHSSAVVTYGDAVLGRGTVPEFCAQTLGVGETTATAWAMGVQMPRFLRNRLAGELERGEAVVDVAVRTPGNCRGCSDTVLVSKAKIGGRPAPSSVTYVYHQSTSKDEL